MKLWIEGNPILRKFLTIISAVILSITCFSAWKIPAKAENPIIIVIDPGHGGENLGGQYNE